MSRRETRDSDSRRHRSRFDCEPSPKRSRRDGKPAAERVPSSNHLDIGDHADQDHTNRRRLQDAVPLEAPSVLDSKVESGSLAKDSDKKPNGLHEKAKGSSDQTEVPLSRSFFQHDERGNAGQVGRSFSRGAAGERDWRRQSRNQKHEGASDKKELSDTRQRDEKSQDKKDGKSWNYDGFYKLEADPPQPARKRRAFREEKIPLDSENADKTSVEPVKASHADRPPLGSERREDRGRNSHYSDRYEKPPTGGDRLTNRGESLRVGYPSRQRYGGGVSGDHGDYRARERYDRRQEFRPDGTRGDKWKHDLFQEANRSPTPKDEEDRIAKLEALLAS